MTSYFIRRLLLVIPTFLGITVLVFAITRVVPGGPIERAMNEALLAQTDSAVMIDMNSVAGAALSEDQLAELRAYYGKRPAFFHPPSPSGQAVFHRELHNQLSSRLSRPVHGVD